MKNSLNRNAFTLMELLAVIVILGVIMLIAIPSISNVITNSRKDAFIRSADMYINAVRDMVTSGTVDYPVDPKKATLVSLRAIDLEGKSGEKAVSTFGGLWDADATSTKAYVVFHNSRTAADPRYTYYFAAVDQKGNCMALTEERTAKRANVTTGCNISEITASTSSITIDSKSLELDSTSIVLE